MITPRLFYTRHPLVNWQINLCSHVIVYIKTLISGLRDRNRDRIVVIFTNYCAISAYHHKSCEFEPRSSAVHSMQHYVIKLASDLRQVDGFVRLLRFPPQIKLKYY